MSDYWDDLLVGAGVVCLAVGLWLWLGWPAALMLVGVVMIAAGVAMAVRGDDRRGLDRAKGG